MQNAVLDPLWRRPGRCWLLARSEERPTFRVKQQNRPFRGAFAQVEANGEGSDLFTFRLTRAKIEASLEERPFRCAVGRVIRRHFV
jgi:hypothetical protein